MSVTCPLPASHKKAKFDRIYSELALHQAVIRAYSKPLFTWRKALGMSHDGRTLYDFARHSLKNVHQLHRQLRGGQFNFREGIALHYNFNGKHRTIHLFPWEERIVDLLLYRQLTKYFHNVFEPSCHAYRMGGFGVDQCQERLNANLKKLPRPVYFIKRDVKDYFPSIDHERLLEMLSEWVEPEDTLFDLLRQRIEFQTKHGDEIITNSRGVAFGTAIACFFANLYLTPLDRRLSQVKGLSYFRYADDLLAFSHDRDTALEAEAIIADSFEELQLVSKPKHHRNFFFVGNSEQDSHFKPCEKFRHLGLEFRQNGGVGLSLDKARKIRNQFKFAWKRYGHKLGKLRSPMGRARKAIAVANDLLEHGYRSVAIIDYYLKHVDDEEIAEAMKEKGLGTPATRAATIEHLIREEYLKREKRTLFPTGKAEALIDFLVAVGAESLTSPSMTGEWESRLRLMEEGKLTRDEFMKGIVEVTRDMVQRTAGFKEDESDLRETSLTSPVDGTPLYEGLAYYQSRDGSFRVNKTMGNRRIAINECEELIKQGKVGPLEGFRSKAGKPFSALIKLDEDNRAVFVFDNPASGEGEPTNAKELGECPVLGKCPSCGGQIHQTPNAFICEKHAQVAKKGSCTVRVTRKLLEKDIPSEEFAKMLDAGKTNLISGFRSRKTRKLFDAFLTLDNKGRLRFEFPPRQETSCESHHCRRRRPIPLLCSKWKIQIAHPFSCSSSSV